MEFTSSWCICYFFFQRIAQQEIPVSQFLCMWTDLGGEKIGLTSWLHCNMMCGLTYRDSVVMLHFCFHIIMLSCFLFVTVTSIYVLICYFWIRHCYLLCMHKVTMCHLLNLSISIRIYTFLNVCTNNIASKNHIIAPRKEVGAP